MVYIMKAITRLLDNQGNEVEHELDELAIFANFEEIQQIIDFLTYVKEDHLVQHRDNHIAVTHSHFSIWKGERNTKTDLQIWSSSDDWLTLDEANQ